MPEIISTPHALVQSTNGKKFYVNSGVVSVDSTETAVIDIDNIGERDILFYVTPMNGSVTSDHLFLRVKSNGVTIFQVVYQDRYDTGPPYEARFLLPANTSLAVTFEAQSGAQLVGVSCYGEYLSMDLE